ncbi:hypothetical protein [Brevibacillus marinus]|uniref:hypothetical protein n=1 Tax=Brevibacillus marinus TaxID=2496837 RepID=UPI0013E00B55|nr:hypothetical protein [Brevibacillus marinus]
MPEHHVNELPIAQLTPEQLTALQQAEIRLNQVGNPVYLIAFARQPDAQREKVEG